MRRGSYRRAIEFIAMNDEPGSQSALNPLVVERQVTAVLVSTVFGVSAQRVGRDVVNFREKELNWENTKAELKAASRRSKRPGSESE